MAGSVCPTCQTPLDPARAPIARVRGSRVVAFCSEECASAPAKVERVRAKTLPAIAVDRANHADEVDDVGVHDDADAEVDGEGALAEAGGLSVASRLPAARLATAPELAARPRGNRKRQIIALSAAIMAGGMIITIINAISPSSPSDVSAASERGGRARSPVPAPGLGPGAEPGSASEAATAPLQKAPPSPPDPQALLAQAKTTLETMLGSPSERVQRVAAMALSRTGDEKAMAKLKELFAREVSELMQIEIAYALARAGDQSVRSHLRDGLQNSRRDVRLEAARAFAKLGDDMGARVLRSMLPLSNHQIAAAEILARLGDPEALKILRKIASEKDTAEATKVRALVALGKAGDAGVREDLARVVGSGSFHVGAAEALATLGDHRAVPPLVAQLASPSLQVMAALSLRRLGVEADIDLRELAGALAAEGDLGRLSAAEAILLLTGPKQLAERD